MGIESAIEYADQLLYERTGKHLSDLQSDIIQQSWKGKTYGQVATLAGYSEGHVKDVASQLWKTLSEALGEQITKGNLRSRLKNRIKRTIKSTPGSATVIAGIRGVQAQIDRSLEPDSHSQDSHSQDIQSTIEESSFFGRVEAIHSLQSLAKTYRILVIKGEGGVGKTTLAQQYCKQLSNEFEHVLELLMAKETENITPIENVVEEWLRQHFNEEPGREFGITLSRLKQRLEAEKAVVLIDNLEPALDSNGQFVGTHRRYVELLRSLSATQATVLITSRDRLCEPSLKVHHYPLTGLALNAWQQFFHSHGVEIGTRSNATALVKMHSAYAGNAKAMEILCAAAIEEFEGDLKEYWQENESNLLGTADLRNLVSSQINRLQQLDADAYRLFCRLGCYRYQDQPTLDKGAIAALMWDVDPSKQKQTVNSLRDRSLIEYKKREYSLHPVSRAEAIERLRSGCGLDSQDWERANRAAADYWSRQTRSMTSVEDALRALEAYYHLIAIADYDSAAAVLLTSRHNQWNQCLPLASSLYRKGLLQPAIHSIIQVLPHIKKRRGELNNILGDAYWITGDIHRAIACQQKTLAAKPVGQTSYYTKRLTVDAHLSIGLYHIDLWELPQAAEQFERVILLAAQTPHQAWADKATIGLSLVQAHLGNRPKATLLAEEASERLMIGAEVECDRYAYFLQLLGQTFSQLGLLDQAKTMYKRALASAETGHYVQVKAKTLVGLAVLQRQQERYLEAIALHHQAIELCQQIGAVCDQAEAYFQLGITLKTVEGEAARELATKGGIVEDVVTNSQNAQGCFEQAISILSEIGAPNQIDRIVSRRTNRGVRSNRQSSRSIRRKL